MKTKAQPITSSFQKMTNDVQMVFWFGSVLMLAASFLPWVSQRPNRLAVGTFQGLSLLELAASILIAFSVGFTGRFAPKLLILFCNLAPILGLWWLGTITDYAMQGQSTFARVSASSGFWLWMTGAGISLYGLGLIGSKLSRIQQLSQWLWLPISLGLVFFGLLEHWSVIEEFRVQKARFFQELLQHIQLVLSAIGIAVLFGVPLAIWASRDTRVASVTLGLTSGIQTVPSLALLGLLIAPLAALSNAFPVLRSLGINGIGTAPALTAMTLYALLPIVQNGIVALQGVSSSILEAASGMGMTTSQRFLKVQLPLALPVWLSGLRQAAVMLVGVASVAQLIGAGGLGFFIFSGLQSGANDLILLGAIPAVLLAVLTDALLRLTEGFLANQFGSIETVRKP